MRGAEELLGKHHKDVTAEDVQLDGAMHNTVGPPQVTRPSQTGIPIRTYGRWRSRIVKPMMGEWNEVGNALGARVVDASLAPWGKKNRTHLLTLDNGRRAVWQQYTDRSAGMARCAALRAFGNADDILPVAIPTVLAERQDGNPPWAAFSYLPGKVAYTAAGDDLSSPAFVRIAIDMGHTVAAIQQLDPNKLPLTRTWAQPQALSSAAHTWLTHLAPHLPEESTVVVRRMLADLPHLFENRPAVVAHGDFGPQNVLVEGGRVTGLLDFEDARLADPLLDVAWWAWLVRAHTPQAFERSWSGMLSASGVDSTHAQFEKRVMTLIICRLLETADHFRKFDPAKFPSWSQRVTATLGWPANALRPVTPPLGISSQM